MGMNRQDGGKSTGNVGRRDEDETCEIKPYDELEDVRRRRNDREDFL